MLPKITTNWFFSKTQPDFSLSPSTRELHGCCEKMFYNLGPTFHCLHRKIFDLLRLLVDPLVSVSLSLGVDLEIKNVVRYFFALRPRPPDPPRFWSLLSLCIARWRRKSCLKLAPLCGRQHHHFWHRNLKEILLGIQTHNFPITRQM